MAGKVKSTKKPVVKKPTQPKNKPAMSGEALALRVTALERAVGALAAGAASRKVLNELLRLGCELTQADAGTVMVLDRPSEMLIFEVVRGSAAVKLQNFRMSVQEGIAGWVVRSGKPLLVPDVARDARFSPKVSRKIRYEARNMICAPILNRDKAIGVIQLLNHRDDDPFHAKDLQTAVILAAAMAPLVLPLVENGLDAEA